MFVAEGSVISSRARADEIADNLDATVSAKALKIPLRGNSPGSARSAPISRILIKQC